MSYDDAKNTSIYSHKTIEGGLILMQRILPKESENFENETSLTNCNRHSKRGDTTITS
jgi:hypothetical protein